MTQTDKWVDETYKELDQRIMEQESLFLDFFMTEYLADLFIDDTTLKNTVGNYNKVNEINDKFDEAFTLFITPFLLWYGKKLLESRDLAFDYFVKQGISSSARDSSSMAKILGIGKNKIIKGSFLWNLGQFGELRQRMQDMVMNAVATSRKFSLLVRDIKPLFKSTKKQRSALSKYYLKYAYQPIMEMLNRTTYNIALKNGFTHFQYVGGLIEKSRDFCIERDGKTFTIEEGKSWNDLDWAGKIDGLDFFVQCGGYNCYHRLNFIKYETETE